MPISIDKKIRKTPKSTFIFEGKTFHYRLNYYNTPSLKNDYKTSLFYEKNGVLSPVKLPEKLKSIVILDTYVTDEEIWFGTDNGLYICNFREGEINCYNNFLRQKKLQIS
ncbi:hypothetical protein BSU00_01710 [Tenacibaculum sp. SG-28]|nr:hypothetical protein BSU00_01710 [Tenacibaculum sp. SG-28]